MGDGLRDYAGGDEKFVSWLRRVSREVRKLSDLDLLDLPDFPLRDSYDAGEDPRLVARSVLTEGGW